MKKLLSVLMVLVLIFSACSKPEEPISEQPETNEPGSSGPSKPISSEEENLLPGGINPEDYEGLTTRQIALQVVDMVNAEFPNEAKYEIKED